MKNYLNSISKFEKPNEKDEFQIELGSFEDVILPQDYTLLVGFVNRLVSPDATDKLTVKYKKYTHGVIYWYKVLIDSETNIEYISAENPERGSRAIALEDDLLVLNNKNKYGILAKRMNGRWVESDGVNNLLVAVSQSGTKSKLSTNSKERQKRFELSDIKNELDEELVSLIEKMFGYRFTVDYIKRDKNNQIEYLYLVSQMVQGNVIVLKYLKEGCFTRKMLAEIGGKRMIVKGEISNDILLQQQGDAGNRWYKIIAEKTLNGYWQTL